MALLGKMRIVIGRIDMEVQARATVSIIVN
jgi:hypothetical protein